MSYEKAMRHTRNVRKVKKQSRQYMGFDTGSGPWPNPRRNPLFARVLEVQEWFRDRHRGDKQYNRECIREAIADVRAMRVRPDPIGT
jgi:hypothetical protein